MNALLLALACSLLATMVVVRVGRRQGNRLLDHDMTGPQKFHAAPVPRVGGIGIFLGVLLVSVGLWLTTDQPLALALTLCALPAFGSGLTEDLTKTQSPRRRLFFTAMSAVLAAGFVDALILRTGLPGLDWVVSSVVGASLVTVFVVAGVSNSINIIDGMNGLASMCVVLILVSIAYVAFQVGDYTIMTLALAGIGAVLGFFVWNFPLGLIFLGDGGAYFLGFFVAELAILLLHRNPDVSPMFPLLVCIYPVFETVFSIYRRKVLRGQPVGMPDGIHLHSLVYRRLMRWAVGRELKRSKVRRNSMTSPYLWFLCMFAVVPAMLWWDRTAVLASFIGLFVALYSYLYWRIVRFRSPRWLITRH
ncbi:MraY family glycosyltransferase [Aquabacterium sp. OR-4]|uniref:MraY family glycosyltransferase n=1 Tax=Aquabacterium sp. OR-4 TaxID=2978127 RepID=UPI003FCDE0EF